MLKKLNFKSIKNIRYKLRDYYNLLFRATHFNYYRVNSCKKEQDGKVHCDVEFGSYLELKKLQKKVRRVSFGASSVVAMVVITSLILNLATGPIKNSLAASYDFTQSSWAGGTSATTAIHDNNQSDWSNYASSSASLDVGTTLKLGTATTSWSQTTTSDFEEGNFVTDTTTTTDSVVLTFAGSAISTAQVVAGFRHNCALTKGGEVYCWGANSSGQIGDGTSGTNKLVPVRVFSGEADDGDYSGSYLSNIKSISAGYSSTCAVSNNNNIYCWGYNGYGQIGDNTSGTSRLAPVRVLRGAAVADDHNGTYLNNIKSVGVGRYRTCAVSNSGNIYCWGKDGNSMVSAGTTLIPARVSKGEADDGDYSGDYLINIKSLNSGLTHACVVSNNDNIYCWGASSLLGEGNSNSLGTCLLAFGYPSYCPDPVRPLKGAVTAEDDYSGNYLANIKLLSAGDRHTCAVSNNDNVYCWGTNGNGQLGTGDTLAGGYTPVQTIKGEAVEGDYNGDYLFNIKSLALGDEFTCASSNSDNFYCWGDGFSGHLGNGTFTDKLSPIRPLKGDDAVIGDHDGTYLTNIESSTAGGGHGCAVSGSNNLYCWGENIYGQLGTNAPSSGYIPVRTHGVDDDGYLSMNYNQVYQSPGTYTSTIHDTTRNQGFGTLVYNATTPDNTDVKVKVRSCSQSDCSDGATFSSCTEIASATDISSNACVTDGDQYVQYQAILTTSDTSVTPSFDDITINYLVYTTSSQTLTSSKYDASTEDNSIGGLQWTEDPILPANTKTSISLRVSSTEEGIASSTWVEIASSTPNSIFPSPACSKNEVTGKVSCDASAIPSTWQDGVGDRYFQYKVAISSQDGSYSPTISAISVLYIVNASPDFNLNYPGVGDSGITAVQEVSTGLVNISYSVRDIDTTTGSNDPGYITPSFAYSVDNGSNWNNITDSTGLSVDATSTKAVDQSGYTEYSLTWNPKADIGSDLFSSQTKIRIIANDNEIANYDTIAITANFSLDIKRTVVDDASDSYEVIKIDGRETEDLNDDEVSVNIKVTQEDSNVEYRYSINPVLDGDGVLQADGINALSGTWISDNNLKTSSTSIIVQLNPNDSLKKDTVYVQFRDAYGNIAGQSDPYSVATPERPTAMMIQDITNTYTDPNQVGLFVTWKVSDMSNGTDKGNFASYTIEKAQTTGGTPAESDYTLLSTITDKNENYYRDDAVPYTGDENYFYRVYVTDAIGNVSYYSATENDDNAVLQGIPNGTQDPSEGGGGSVVATVITHATSSQASSTSKTITIAWTTDQTSNSSLDYVDHAQYLINAFSSATTIGAPTMIEADVVHSVTAVGLDSNTVYHYRIRSTNVSGIEGTSDEGYSITTQNGVVILGAPQSQVNNNSATITWYTDVSANSYVVYANTKTAQTLNSPQVSGSDTLISQTNGVYKHSVTVGALSGDYFYYVRSTDEGGNKAEDKNTQESVNEFYFIQTTDDTIAPSIESEEIVMTTDITAVIKWRSDEIVKGKIYYKLSTSQTYINIASTTEYNIDSVIVISNLTHTKTYDYYIEAEDRNGNTSSSTPAQFNTAETQVSHEALTNPGDPTVSQYSDTEAIIVLPIANSNAYAKICYDSSTITNVDTCNGGSATSINNDTSSKSHYFHLTGLSANTDYYLQTRLTDSEDSGNTQDSSVVSFTTKTVQIDHPDLTNPGNPSIDSYSDTEALITISADASSDAKLCYATSTISDVDTCLSSISTINTRLHSFHITGLNDETTYYIKSKIADAVNSSINFTSGSNSFTTLTTQTSHPDLTDPGDPVVNLISNSEVVVTVSANTLSESKLCYDAIEANISDINTCPNSQTSSNSVIHTFHITNLSSSTTYYFKSKTTDSESGNSFVSNNIQDTTLSTPVAEEDLTNPGDPSVTSSSDTEATIVIPVTNTDATSKLCYDTLEANVDDIDTCPNSTTIDTPTKTHSYHLTSLTASTTYYFKTKIIDSASSSIYYISNTVSFETETDPSVVPDLTDPGAPSVVHYSDTEALITIPTTNADAISKLCYDTASSSVDNMDTCPVSIEINTPTKTHSYHLFDLTANTKYYFKTKIIDSVSSANSFTSTRDNFTTLETQIDQPDLENPGNISIDSISDNEAFVSIPMTNIDTISEFCYSESSIATVDSNCTNYDTIGNPTKTHYFHVTGLTPNTEYYFRAKVTDTEVGNMFILDEAISTTAIIQVDHDELTNPGTPDSTNVLSNTENGAIISWETNTPSTAMLCYLIDSHESDANILAETCSNELNSNTATRNHVFNLTGLNPSTDYYYRIKTIDYVDASISFTSTSSASAMFTTSDESDIAPPVITTGPTVTPSLNGAIISIITDEGSIAIVEYLNTQSNFNADHLEISSSKTYKTNHTLELTGLIQNQVYYYKVKAQDNKGNTITYDDGGNYYSFVTTQDTTAPNISNISVNTTNNSATITWSTDELSDSIINYGTTSDYGQTATNTTLTTIHVIELANLTASTTYHYEVNSSDANSNLAQEIDATFITQGDFYTEEEMQTKENEVIQLEAEVSTLEAQVAEEQNSQSSGGGTIIIDKTDKIAPKISNVKVSKIGDEFATVTWKTNERANSMVFYGLSLPNKTILGGDSNAIKNLTINHQIKIENLSPLVTYHFSAVSQDSWANLSQSPDFSFTTLSRGEESGNKTALGKKEKAEIGLDNISAMVTKLLKEGKADKEAIRDAIKKTGEPPMISGEGPVILEVTSKTALINWETDRKSNSVVVYYPSDLGIESSKQVGNFSELTKDHSIRLTGLTSGVKYSFIAQSTDALGNVGASKVMNFGTESIPYIARVTRANLSNSSIEISWQSNTETTTEIDYGTTDKYGKNIIVSDNYTLNHNLKLTGLESGQLYHFKVKGLARGGELISSDDYTFTTLTSPDVLSYDLLDVKDKAVSIAWKTNNKTSSEVVYTNLVTELSETIASSEMKTSHRVELLNLIPGDKYSFAIKGIDEYGQTVESDKVYFTTMIDTEAPIIEYVQTDMALISKGDSSRVQAVITWKTDELSSTELIFTEGAARNLELEVSSSSDATIIKGEKTLTKKHVLVVTDFKPGTVYTFKAKSIDESGNVSHSKDYTVLAPSKKESVLQVIMGTFEDTFGWLKFGG